MKFKKFHIAISMKYESLEPNSFFVKFKSVITIPSE